MERSLSECGYYISKDSSSEGRVEIEIACKNCPFTTWKEASANNLANARSKAIVEANEERRKFCPILKPHSPDKFEPGEKKVPECFTPQSNIEQNLQSGWVELR